MAFLKLFSIAFLFSLLFLLSSAQKPPFIPCKSTPSRELCRALHATFKSNPSDPYRHGGMFTVNYCLNKTVELYGPLNRYLNSFNPSDLLPDEFYAMLTCIDRASTGNGFDLKGINVLLEKERKMSEGLVEKVKSILTSVVEEQQKCYNGLVEAKSLFPKAMSKPTGNMTRLYDVARAVVAHAIERNSKGHKNY